MNPDSNRYQTRVQHGAGSAFTRPCIVEAPGPMDAAEIRLASMMSPPSVDSTAIMVVDTVSSFAWVYPVETCVVIGDPV